MRYLFLLLLGLTVGAVGATMVSNAARLRHAYPRGVMAVMQHHFAALHHAVRGNQCPAPATIHDLDVMDTMAGEIQPALGAAEDVHLVALAAQLQDTLKHTLQSPPADCKSLASALPAIGERCDDCHREYR